MVFVIAQTDKAAASFSHFFLLLFLLVIVLLMYEFRAKIKFNTLQRGFVD